MARSAANGDIDLSLKAGSDYCSGKVHLEAGQALTMPDRAASTPTRASGHRTFREKALKITRNVVIATVYLWILFALFNLYKTALLQEHGIDYWDQGYAFLSAMVFGKVLLIGDMLNIGQSLRKRALVWVVLGRSFIFAFLIILFHVVLNVIRAWYDSQPVVSSIMKIGGGTWFGFSVYAAIVFFTLIPLAAFRELSYVLGDGAIWRLMTSRERNI